MRRLTTKEFIEKSKLVHGEKYSYNNVVYNKSNIHVAITCLKHGDFLQKPNVHLCGRGCPKCKIDIHKKIFTQSQKQFIEKARKVHGDKYDYSLVKYVNSHNTVKIMCQVHGMFEQKAYTHIDGHGCTKCVYLRKEFNKHQRERPSSWSISNWQKTAERSRNFDSFKTYIIKCWNEYECFYKVGRTFVTINKRFSKKTSMPYKYEVVQKYVFNTAKEAHNKETELKRLNKEFKHIPSIKFCGMYECFRYINLR